MRVTDGMKYLQIRRNLDNLSARHADASEQALSGRRVNAPSSDPVAAAELTRLKSAQAQTQAHRDAIRSVRGDVELSESALSEAGNLLARLREVVVQGASDSLSSADRQALAAEVSGIHDQLLTLANTEGSRGYVFAGSATTTPPFLADGTFQGNTEDHEIEIGPGQRATVNASGARAFTGDGGRDIFADVKALEAALRTNDAPAIRDSIATVDSAREQVVREQVRMGLVIDKLSTTDAVLESIGLNFAKVDDSVGSVDPYESYTKLTQLAQALEHSVTVSRTLLDVGRQSF
jgi:flagellar hook-associated protein 3 FlgL